MHFGVSTCYQRPCFEVLDVATLIEYQRYVFLNKCSGDTPWDTHMLIPGWVTKGLSKITKLYCSLFVMHIYFLFIVYLGLLLRYANEIKA